MSDWYTDPFFLSAFLLVIAIIIIIIAGLRLEIDTRGWVIIGLAAVIITIVIFLFFALRNQSLADWIRANWALVCVIVLVLCTIFAAMGLYLKNASPQIEIATLLPLVIMILAVLGVHLSSCYPERTILVWVLLMVIILLVIVISVIILNLLKKKKYQEIPDTIDVVCSFCGTVVRLSKYNLPSHFKCSNCGRKGPIRFRE